MTYKVLSDEYIERLFEGTNFGEPINSCVETKKKFIAHSLQKSLDGYWLGETSFRICVFGGFLIDTPNQGTKLTLLGKAFIEQYQPGSVNDPVYITKDRINIGSCI